ncbi:unnamed protein product [Amoebophrya sp. A120]|nr:unnamed protein product [Amoebophrya sp. A120]|eukprot:GSA120T00016892001.1
MFCDEADAVAYLHTRPQPLRLPTSTRVKFCIYLPTRILVFIVHNKLQSNCALFADFE